MGFGLGAGLSVGVRVSPAVGVYVPVGAGLGADDGFGLGAGESVGAVVCAVVVFTLDNVAVAFSVADAAWPTRVANTIMQSFMLFKHDKLFKSTTRDGAQVMKAATDKNTEEGCSEGER